MSIEKLFTPKEKTAQILIGGLEICRSKGEDMTHLIRISRKNNKYQKVFLTSSAWERFGMLRASIKIIHELSIEASKFVQCYLKQFVKEACEFVKEKHWTYHELTHSRHKRVNECMRDAFDQTSTLIDEFHSQMKAYDQSCVLPLLREELKVTYFYYCKQLVLDAMKVAKCPFGSH